MAWQFKSVNKKYLKKTYLRIATIDLVYQLIQCRVVAPVSTISHVFVGLQVGFQLCEVFLAHFAVAALCFGFTGWGVLVLPVGFKKSSLKVVGIIKAFWVFPRERHAHTHTSTPILQSGQI